MSTSVPTTDTGDSEADAAADPDAGEPPHDDGRHRLGAVTGTAALGLDALASVAYGPEAIVVVLAAAGSAGLGATLPITAGIVALLLVLVACYRQVITAYPDGGGAYTVARRNLGPRAALVAAASLVVDYVLNVAVSVAAGVAALTSAAPALLPWTPELCLAVVVVVTLVNLRGLVASARLFIGPAVVFVIVVGAVVVVGLVRGAPLSPLPAPTPSGTVGSVGVLLLLAAFANGCAALTGIEAIANATPAFRAPGTVRARRAEAALGIVLGLLLIGLAVLIERFDARPVDGRTLLSLVAEGAVGHGALYLVVQISTVVLLALAANTSFGGLPVLAARLAGDGYLPHLFGLRGDRLVHRWGVLVLGGLAAVLLLVSGGDVNVLVPVFAVGVFIGFFLCQLGMVRHWRRERGPGWRRHAAVNASGVVLTGLAAVVVTVSKFAHGAWLVVVVVPLLVLLFSRVRAAYARLGARLGVDRLPPSPHAVDTLAVVPVVAVNRLTQEVVSTALALGHRVVAVHVAYRDEPRPTQRLRAEWSAWHPDVPLEVLCVEHREPASPLCRFVREAQADRVVVLIGEVRPSRPLEGLLLNRRGAVIARRLSRETDAVVCRWRATLTAPGAEDRADHPRGR